MDPIAAPTHEFPHIRFTLDWLEITDSMDLDGVGEFRFLFRVRSDLRGVLRDTLLPEEGTVSISERAGHNHLGPLDLVLYEGPVERGERVTLEVTGEEVDLLSPNDEIEYYERSFTGDPDGWVGTYAPWDGDGSGGRDPEQRAQWLLSYRIERADPAARDGDTPVTANSR
jgi:hypothetical protein